jgi:hypothetical protein
VMWMVVRVRARHATQAGRHATQESAYEGGDREPFQVPLPNIIE